MVFAPVVGVGSATSTEAIGDDVGDREIHYHLNQHYLPWDPTMPLEFSNSWTFIHYYSIHFSSCRTYDEAFTLSPMLL